jgi:hypothetical protein
MALAGALHAAAQALTSRQTFERSKAMLDQINRIGAATMERMLENAARFLPGVAVLFVILLLTVIVALAARLLVLRTLRRTGFDERAGDLGLPVFAELASGAGPAMVVARVVQWTILFLGLLVGISALDAALPTQLALMVFEYLPGVLAALVILGVGTVLARHLARSVLVGAVNLQLQWARLLSTGVKWLILVLAWTMALEHLGLGGLTLRIAFAILFGGMVFAMALAIGLGAKDMIGRSLERQLHDTRKPPAGMDHV